MWHENGWYGITVCWVIWPIPMLLGCFAIWALPCEKCEWWGYVSRRRWTFWKNRSLTKRHAGTDTVENTRDGGSTSEWPFLQTNLFVVTNPTNSFLPSPYTGSFSRSLQQRWHGSLPHVTWARYPRPAQLLRFLKSSECACVKIQSASGLGGRRDKI